MIDVYGCSLHGMASGHHSLLDDEYNFDWCYKNPYGPYVVAERYVHWRRLRIDKRYDRDDTDTLNRLLNTIFVREQQNAQTLADFVSSLRLYDIWNLRTMQFRYEYILKKTCARLCGTDSFGWEHVVTLYVYLCYIATHAAKTNRPFLLRTFIDCFVTQTKLNSKWIESHGGWDKGLESLKKTKQQPDRYYCHIL